MPTLDWIGKKAVVGHHRQVPYRLLHCNGKLSAGDPDAGNLLVQGDNLLALKALLPYYAGKVKCIYIDPPYNTGNEKWVYNDAVNSPEMRDWLGKVVGAEAEDLSRHDKWLCMIYPRLSLLREFLADDGAIFISIDDNELQHLLAIMDEVFGKRNFVANIVWQKRTSPDMRLSFSTAHDYVVVYAKSIDKVAFNKVPKSAEQAAQFKNPDNDPRGPWVSSDSAAPARTTSMKRPAALVVSIAFPPKSMTCNATPDFSQRSTVVRQSPALRNMRSSLSMTTASALLSRSSVKRRCPPSRVASGFPPDTPASVMVSSN